MQLILANPPRRRRRKARTSKRRRLSAAARRAALANLAKARANSRPRRRSRRRSNPPAQEVLTMARRRRSSAPSRRRSRSRSRSSPGGFISSGTLMAVAGTAGGFIAANVLPDRLPLPDALKTGYGRIGAKVGIGILARMLLKGRNATLGNSLAVGAMTSAALDLFNNMTNRSGSASALAPAIPVRSGVAGYLGTTGDVIEYAGMGSMASPYARNFVN